MPANTLYGQENGFPYGWQLTDPLQLAYLSLLLQLLPEGPAWPRDPDTNLALLLQGLAIELAWVDAEAQQVIEDSPIGELNDNLEAWGAFTNAGQCGSSGDTIEARRASVAARLTRTTSPTPAGALEIAARFGYTDATITRTFNTPFTCISNCNDSLYAGQWYHSWGFTATSQPDYDERLECELEQLTPQHGTLVLTLT